MAAKTKAATDTLSVKYQAGPEELNFAGRQWKRGEAQPVTADEWAAMQARADFNEHQFTEE